MKQPIFQECNVHIGNMPPPQQQWRVAAVVGPARHGHSWLGRSTNKYDPTTKSSRQRPPAGWQSSFGRGGGAVVTVGRRGVESTFMEKHCSDCEFGFVWDKTESPLPVVGPSLVPSISDFRPEAWSAQLIQVSEADKGALDVLMFSYSSVHPHLLVRWQGIRLHKKLLFIMIPWTLLVTQSSTV